MKAIESAPDGVSHYTEPLARLATSKAKAAKRRAKMESDKVMQEKEEDKNPGAGRGKGKGKARAVKRKRAPVEGKEPGDEEVFKEGRSGGSSSHSTTDHEQVIQMLISAHSAEMERMKALYEAQIKR